MADDCLTCAPRQLLHCGTGVESTQLMSLQICNTRTWALSRHMMHAHLCVSVRRAGTLLNEKQSSFPSAYDANAPSTPRQSKCNMSRQACLHFLLSL
jgi:hypothetical protein